MTKIEFIEKLGPERYKKHLEEQRVRNDKRYANPEIREKIKERQRKYSKTHKPNYELIAKNKASKMLKDPDAQLEMIIARAISSAIVAYLGIKQKGFEIHHCFGLKRPRSFLYLAKPDHRKIHSLFGYKNDMCKWNKIRQYVVDSLIPFILVEDSKITFMRK